MLPPAAIPIAPTGLAAFAANEAVALSWEANSESDLAGYHVFRSTTSGTDYEQITNALVDTCEYVDNTVSNGTNYYYVVEAVDTDANRSGYSNEVNATPVFKETTYLSDLTWVSVDYSYAEPKLDVSIDGNTLTIGGQEYEKGIGAHAHSEIVYKLAGAYNTFISYIGIDDEKTSGGSCEFIVYLDGSEVYNSGVLTVDDAPVLVEVDVTNAYELKLVVTDGGNGIGSDHGNWADAKIITEKDVTGVSISPASLTLDEGQTGQLTETVSPDDATDKSVTWSSDNTSVANVDENGLVRAVSEGNATITATTNDGGYTATSEIEVNAPTTSISGKEELIPEVSLYPNPASGNGYVQVKIDGFPAERVNVKVIDFSGKLIQIIQKDIKSNQIIYLDIKKYNPGIYAVQVFTTEKVITRKLVIR